MTLLCSCRRSERTRRNSQPKPKVKSVASSVWSRLSKDNKNSRATRDSDSETSISDSEHSGTSTSSEENLRITRTMNAESDEENSNDDSEEGESKDYSSDDGGSGAHGSRTDLRSKLSHKDVPRNGKSRSTISQSVSKPRSPLRIEIDNDEYYRSLREEKD